MFGACGNDSEPQLGTEAPSDGFRTLQHELGTARLPRVPERIISLSPEETEISSRSACVPVGAVVGYGADSFSPYITGKTSGIEVVGRGYEPSIEAIARLAPDVIIGQAESLSDIFGRLQGIAPTVAVASRDAWKDKTIFLGDVVGKPEAAQQALNEYQRRVKDVQGKLARPAAETSLSVLGVFGPQEVSSYGLN